MIQTPMVGLVAIGLWLMVDGIDEKDGFPAMVAAWALGLALIWYNGTLMRGGFGYLLQPWMLTKLVGVLFLTGWHTYLGVSRKALAQGLRPRSERFWRMTNELPFLAAIVMVLAVTTEFGS